MREALQLYERALGGTGVDDELAGMRVRFDDGSQLSFPVSRFLAPADRHDRSILNGIRGPVLDVGCGPGRHLRALSARGVYALGVDLSPMAVALARSSGASAMVADVFEELPGAGSWRSALLLDGNVGIGGRPARLLERLRALLCPGGVILLEVEPPGSVSPAVRARIEAEDESSGWFAWARVAADEVGALAAAAGMTIAREWSCGGRWFARLHSTRRD